MIAQTHHYQNQYKNLSIFLLSIEDHIYRSSHENRDFFS